MAEEKNYTFGILALVAIVAVVGIVVLFMNTGSKVAVTTEKQALMTQTSSTATSGNIAGQAGGQAGLARYDHGFVVKDVLEEGETATYKMRGENYEVIADFIDELSVYLIINGENTGSLSLDESHVLNNGMMVTVLEIGYSATPTYKRWVEFALQKPLNLP